MASYERSAGGAEELPAGVDPMRQLRAKYIGRMLRVLNERGRGAQAVHVLHPASWRTQHFHKERLVDFRPYTLSGQPEQPRQAWVNGEHLAGWIIPDVIQFVSPALPRNRTTMLLLADGRCAHGGPPPSWTPSEMGLLVPKDRLMPIEQTPPNAELHIVERALLSLMPSEYFQNPTMLLDPPYNSG